jgi:hypothetical protein
MTVDWRRLLKHIVDHHVVPAARTEAQLDANAVQDVMAEANAISDNQRDDADELGVAFEKGMELAMRGNGRLEIDDTTPEGSAIASAMARYLVATDLAESQSTPLGNEHYSYTFDVNWPRIQQIAQAAGVKLPADPSGGSR